jgi:NTP pyrophosphatase (non-canonical NTP hydrolase)
MTRNFGLVPRHPDQLSTAQEEIMMPMTFGQFSQANRERCESPLGFNHPINAWSTSDWMTATMGELGEAANVVKKLNRVRDGVPGNKVSADELRVQLRKELGDVFVYLDLMCQSLGFSVADAAAEVFNSKSAEIGYPVQL